MPRARIRRVDDNQPEVVKVFWQLGWWVLILSEVGRGCPDLAVGKFDHTYLIEIKDGSKPPSRRTLTDDEEAFWREWRGSIVLIESVDDVVEFNRKRSS